MSRAWTTLQSLRDIDRFPPALAAAVARNGRKPRSYAEIAARAGIHRISAIRIARRASWSKMTVDMALRFSEACGVNLLHPGDQIAYLKKRKKLTARQVKLLTRLRAAPPKAP